MVADASDLDGHPYIESRALVVEVEDHGSAPFPMHNVSPRLSRTPGEIRHLGPALGAHSIEVLKDLSLDDAEIAQLLDAGIVHDKAD